MSLLRSPQGPQRIVCLTEEPTEILYLLGEQERIVGISAYTVRPPEAPQQKPVVSAFIGGNVEKICALKPDLIIGFSDIQAELARQLVAANQQVLIFNQRSLQEILDVIITIGNLVGKTSEAKQLANSYIGRLERTRTRNFKKPVRPKVYFEEWDEPMICGIHWVSELIEIAGGTDVFATRSRGKLAKERQVTVEDVAQAAPDIMLASWCGKALDKPAVYQRTGMGTIPALINKQLYEVPASIILQPGPACLTDGLDFIENILTST